jgi:outer membrane protein
MKNASLIANAVLGVAVAVLYVLHFTGTGTNEIASNTNGLNGESTCRLHQILFI